MHTEDLQAFADAVKYVFSNMLGADAKVGPAQLENEDETANIAVVIGLSGDVVGSAVLSLSENTALNVVRRLAGMELKVCDADFSDALSSLLNMIVDQAQTKFDELNMERSLAQIVVGSHLHVLGIKRQPVSTLPCETSFGTLQLQVSMIRRNDSLAA